MSLILRITLHFFAFPLTVQATVINNNFGLTAPNTMLGFDEFGTDGVQVQDQLKSQPKPDMGMIRVSDQTVLIIGL